MRFSTFGAIVASSVVGLTGSLALAEADSGSQKACYRTHCGTSVKGHDGKCGGTRVDGLTSQGACEAAGGAWTTAADAKKFEKSE